MAHAILLSLEYRNFEDIRNCLKSYKLISPDSQIVSTPSNNDLSSKLSEYLKVKTLIHENFDSPNSLFELINNKKSLIIYESSIILQALLSAFITYKENLQFEGVGYTLNRINQEWTEFELSLENFPTYYSDSDTEDPLDMQNNLKLVNQEWLDFNRKSSESLVSNLEKMKTNIILTSLISTSIEKKIDKILNVVEKNRYQENPRLVEVTETAKRVKGLKNRLQEMTEQVKSMKTLSIPAKVDLSALNTNLPLYEIGTLTWSHSKSPDHRFHNFEIENKTTFDLKNISLYCSFQTARLCDFSIQSLETKRIELDFLADELKNEGVLDFDLFYCSFQLAKSIQVHAVKIKVETFGSDTSRIKINYENLVTAIKSATVMLNDVNKSKTDLKIYEKSSIVVATGNFKGQLQICFMKDNKVISNTETLVI